MSDLCVIAGLGVTGISCVRYLKERGVSPIAVIDSRLNPPYLSFLQQTYPDVQVALGALNTAILEKATRIILSPGIARQEPAIAQQIKRNIPVIGDIELFAQAVNVPVIAITGTNAKSTVTTLVGKMASTAGFNVQVGGNLGVPVLDLLMKGEAADLFVLELSSFQLETTYTLKSSVASILNISPDHMDRYKTFADYQAAKHRIYTNCRNAVCNRDDPLTDSKRSFNQKLYFTLNTPRQGEFGLITQKNKTYLAFGDQLLIATDELPVKGKHYQANALAALAIGHSFGLPIGAMLQALREFKGLPHRCQFVRERLGVSWFNDSKGTNVGATLAAIEGLGGEIAGKLVLIAGGVGKNADFNPLIPVLKKYARHVILLGEAKGDLSKVLQGSIPLSLTETMEEAVLMASEKAVRNDSVLLSPACASFDMFANFEQRGDMFAEIVRKLS